jgi:hypothetical protein
MGTTIALKTQLIRRFGLIAGAKQRHTEKKNLINEQYKEFGDV